MTTCLLRLPLPFQPYTEDSRTEKETKKQRKTKDKRSALEVKEEERHTICSTL